MKERLFPVLRVLLAILLTFSIIGVCLSVMGYLILKSPDYLIAQVDKTNTYENAFNSIIKKFDDNYNATSIPVEVIKQTVTPEWTRNAIDGKIRAAFGQIDDETVQGSNDYSAISDVITKYFEEYAHEKHAIKDEVYKNKLAESIEYTTKTVSSSIDVYRLDTMMEAGIWSKVGRVRSAIPYIMNGCIGLTIVLTILLILLKRPVYWLGTTLFASGLIMVLPATYVKMSDLIMRFSLKEYTTFTLVTGTMNDMVQTVLIAGICMTVAGCVFVGISVVRQSKGH